MLIPVAQIIYHDLRSNEKVIKWCVPSVQSICQENVDICFILIDLTYIVFFIFPRWVEKLEHLPFFSNALFHTHFVTQDWPIFITCTRKGPDWPARQLISINLNICIGKYPQNIKHL